jgi:hypothetical protein
MSTLLLGNIQERISNLIRIEILFTVAIATLFLQVFPTFLSWAIRASNPLNWVYETWLILQLLILSALCLLRFGGESIRNSTVAVLKFFLSLVGLRIVLALLAFFVPYLRGMVYRWLPPLLQLMDFRTWSQLGWLVFSLFFLVILCLIRFSPIIVLSVTEIHRWCYSLLPTSTNRQAELSKKQKLEDERKLYARMKEARRRQIY